MPSIRLEETEMLVQMARDRLKAYRPDDPRWDQAVQRIGSLLVTRTVVNITTPSQSRHLGVKPLVDTGRLRRSIRSRFDPRQGGGVSIIVGSFGVPYARIHEFGTIWAGGTLRLARKAAYPPRPYLRPALQDSRDRIIDIIRSLGG
jgi:HK97 gp10 family phage protein